jgi:3-methyladenine DNA glycosylase AlkD
MPTVLRIGPYKFYFYSHDLLEPPHIHVDRDDQSAKFWLSPVALAYNLGFRKHELRKIKRLIAEHHDTLLEGWNENFNAATG